MPPYLALLLWFVMLVGLFWFDPAKEPKVSGALWVPLIFLFFMASRQPTQWLSGQVIAVDEASMNNATFFSLSLAFFGLIFHFLPSGSGSGTSATT